MAVIDLDPRNYESILSRDGIVIVDCWAAACKGCRDFAPIYERVSAKYPGHTFAKLDTHVEEDLTTKLGVTHVPSLMLQRDGVVLFMQAGNFDEERLEDIVRQAESLDMDAVRAEIQRHQEAANGAGD